MRWGSPRSGPRPLRHSCSGARVVATSATPPTWPPARGSRSCGPTQLHHHMPPALRPCALAVQVC
eukprot:6211214-Pleurochrysis_carterae.AAC.2